MNFTAKYEELPKIAKIIIQVILGGIVGGVYRILRYLETKNIVTLVVGVVGLVTGVGNCVLWVLDLISEVLNNKITFFAD